MMNLNELLDEAYQAYFKRANKHCMPFVWSKDEWLEHSSVAADIINEHWTIEDGKADANRNIV